MEEWKYRIKYFVEDNLKVLTIVGILVIATILGFVAFTFDEEKSFDKKNEKDITMSERLLDYENKKNEVRNYFSQINEINTGLNENIPIIEVDVYLKTPYEEDKVIKEQIENLIDTYKFQYNISNKKFLAGMKINMYTRYADYREGLEPLHIAEYYYNVLSKADKKEVEEREENGEVIKLSDVQWENTAELTKQPNYDKEYTLNLKYNPYNIDVVALTDEEYEFYLKLMKYELISGNLSSAIKLYIEWEYGLPVNAVGGSIVKQFEKFIERETLNHSNKDNPYRHRRYNYINEIIKEYPMIYLYNTTKYVAKDNIEAMQILVRTNPDKYRDLFVDYLMDGNEDESLEDVHEDYDNLSKQLEDLLENKIENDGTIIAPEGYGVDMEDLDSILQNSEVVEDVEVVEDGNSEQDDEEVISNDDDDKD